MVVTRTRNFDISVFDKFIFSFTDETKTGCYSQDYPPGSFYPYWLL